MGLGAITVHAKKLIAIFRKSMLSQKKIHCMFGFQPWLCFSFFSAITIYMIYCEKFRNCFSATGAFTPIFFNQFVSELLSPFDSIGISFCPCFRTLIFPPIFPVRFSGDFGLNRPPTLLTLIAPISIMIAWFFANCAKTLGFLFGLPASDIDAFWFHANILTQEEL
jgi:hypothetical protein